MKCTDKERNNVFDIPSTVRYLFHCNKPAVVLENEIKNIIYNLEQHSSHPIAKSLCKVFANNNDALTLTDIKEIKGVSISATIQGQTYVVGSSKIVDSNLNHDLFLLKNNQL